MKWIGILALVAAIALFFDWAKDTKFVKDMFPDIHWDYRWDKDSREIKIDYD